MHKMYILEIDTPAPEDLDDAVRRAVGYMSEDIDSSGDFPLRIRVTDLFAGGGGGYVTEHEYDPNGFDLD